MTSFHERLRALRHFKKMTLEDLAVALETTKTTLSRYENAKRIPDADFIIKTAVFFRVSADYLLCLSDNPVTVSDLIQSKRLLVDDLCDEDLLKVNDYIDSLRTSYSHIGSTVSMLVK